MSAPSQGSKPDAPDGPPASSYAELWDRPGYLIRRLHQIHVALFYEECAGSNITPVQFGVLSILNAEESMDQRRLGAEVGIDRTNIADVLARLEARGLIERVVSPEDRRMKLASITREGLKFVKELRRSMERAQERLVAPLNPEERSDFMAYLRRLVQANNDIGRARLRDALIQPKLLP